MSAKNVRRHRTVREVVDLERRRTDKVLGLLAIRDRLAAAAAEYEAHDLGGVTELLTQQYQVESVIRALAPALYERRWTEWVESDATRSHTADQPQEACSVCMILGAVEDPRQAS